MSTVHQIKESNLIASGYKEPSWSGICEKEKYSLDVLKDGVITNNLPLDEKAFYILGRFKTCDFVFEHPSLSRFHAVLQYCAVEENDEQRDKGWYIMDLESTHGTIVNKNKINALSFVRIRSGYVLKFGGSSRLYIVNGPEDDKDPISKHSWTELNEMKEKAKLLKSMPIVEDNTGACMWGMDNDSEDDESVFTNPETIQKYPHEKLYKDDPKKVIKWYFDREGIDEGPLYNFTNNGFNKSTCVLELPVFGENGNKINAEVTGSEKKKEMIERCALQACYMLDELDELYKSGGASVVPKKDLKYYQDKDYYSSEEDEFFDRTGDLEQKRLQRMRRFGVIDDKPTVIEKKMEAKDIDSPLIKLQRLEEINNEILSIYDKLEEVKKAVETDDGASEIDEIEKYLQAIQSGTLNREGRLKLKARIFELQREENLLRKQLKLSIPVTETMRKTLFINEEIVEKKREPSISIVKEKVDAPMKVKNVKIKLERPKIISGVFNNIKKCNDTFDEEDDDDDESCDKIKENAKDDIKSSKDLKRVISSIENEKEKTKKNPKIVLEEDTIDWVPPQDQSGDGRTFLNDRLGY